MKRVSYSYSYINLFSFLSFKHKNTQLAIYNISKVSNIEPIVNGFQIAGRPVTLLYVNGAHMIDIKGLEKLV